MKKIIVLLISLFVFSAQGFALGEKTVIIKVVINKTPEIGTFYPADGTIVTEGDTLEISVEASDPNNDILRYQFLINGVIKKPWGPESKFSYILGKGDIGLNRIKAEVTDGLETVPTNEIEIYVFRKSPSLP